MMRRMAMLFAILLLLLPTVASAQETDIGALIDEELNDLQTGDLDAIYADFDDQVTAIFGEEGFHGLISSMAQGKGIDWKTGAGGLLDYVVSRFQNRIGLLLALVALSVAGGIVGQFRSGSSPAGLVCYALGIILAICAFAQTAADAKTQVATAKQIMELTLPALLTMLNAAGAVASSSALTPMAGVLTTSVMSVFSQVILPAILAMGICVMVGNLSRQKSLERVNGFLKSAVKWIGGAVSMLYLGYGAIVGFSAKGADGLSVKLMRYSADKLIPVVGSMVSGSIDTVLHTSVLIKNALGAGSVLLLLGVMLTPLIDIMTLQLTFRLTAALTEPYGDERMVKGISALGDVMSYLFAAVTGIAVMFAVTVGFIASAGSALV